MEAALWSDYLCPWCYIGQDRTALLESLGVRVTPRPFELHPRIPPEGRPIDAGRYARFVTMAEEVGLPMVPPAWVPNTRHAHETAVVVRRQCSRQVAADLDRLLFAAYWVEARNIGDAAVVDDAVRAAGADADSVRAAVAAGAAVGEVDASREAAYDAGATGAPAWLIDGRALIPGLQARTYFERVVTKLRS